MSFYPAKTSSKYANKRVMLKRMNRGAAQRQTHWKDLKDEKKQSYENQGILNRNSSKHKAPENDAKLAP